MNKLILKQEIGNASNNFCFLVLEQLAKIWKILIDKDQWEITLPVPSVFGNGSIRCWSFLSGIHHIIFDLTLHKRLELNYCMPGKSLSLFSFCNVGSMEFKFSEPQHDYELEAMEGSMLNQQPGTRQTLVLPGGNQRISGTILAIETRRLLAWANESLHIESLALRKWMDATIKETQVKLYTMHQFHILECLHQMKEISGKGLTRLSFAMSKVLEMLSFHFEHLANHSGKPGRMAPLGKADFSKIIEARDILLADLVNPPVIKDLARKVGLNQQKLKVGFKLALNDTINQYLRNKRLEYAFKLLQQEGATVQEVVHRVGYTNTSHFSRWFKEKYGFSPKSVQKKTKEQIFDSIKNNYHNGENRSTGKND